jgi:AcrR family transcriptional regulator
MGRPKGFSREEVLEKAMPVFWKHGFADTSVQELDRATGVNKSGLYTEFRDKEDLFVGCLRHYLESQGKRGLLTKDPLGWKNVETSQEWPSSQGGTARLFFCQIYAGVRDPSG